MTHQIELTDLMNFHSTNKIVYARSTKENKILYCTLRNSYEVWHLGKLVIETMQPFVAVEKYNSI